MTSQTTLLRTRLGRAVTLAALSTAMISTATLPAAAQNYYVPAVQKTTQQKPASIADLVERISPAVVNIKVTTANGETTSEGQGSGFIISPQGEVVTNYHVIEGGDKIEVVFNNGVSFPAQIRGTDEETDLALLQIRSAQPFPHVNFYQGNKMRIGDWVIAIGNPFGIGQSTSLGIISAIGRDRVESGAYVDYIQTDATINRGNSGGPLFNPQGQVVGVNSAIFSPTGASVGIAFSIPHHTAEDVINAIRRDGRVRRGYVGAGLRTAEFSGGMQTSGAIIDSIVPGSPAQLHGLRIDDIIMQINGTPVANSAEATRLIGKFTPGQQVNFLIERSEQMMTAGLQVTERPSKSAIDRARSGGSGAIIGGSPSRGTSPAPSAPSRSAASGTGMSLVDLSSTFRSNIGMRHDQVGIYVEGVAPGSHASSKGIKSNMVLLELDSKPIASVSAFRSMISKAKRNNLNQVRLLVRTIEGSESLVSLPI